MLKFLAIEIVISLIFSFLFPSSRETLATFIGSVIGCMIAGLIPSYIIAVCITRKSPRIHKIACISFCIIWALVGFQKLYDYSQLQSANAVSRPSSASYTASSPAEQTPLVKDLSQNFSEYKQVSKDYKPGITTPQMEKDLKNLTDGLLKTMLQSLFTHLKQIHVPASLYTNPAILQSKASLNAAISKQEASIKQYTQDTSTGIHTIIQQTKNEIQQACVDKYGQSACQNFTPFHSTELENKLLKGVEAYKDYLETELQSARFIYKHYNKFTTSGSYPHFVDASLQKQFMQQIQEVDKKAQAVLRIQQQAWQNTKNVLRNF